MIPELQPLGLARERRRRDERRLGLRLLSFVEFREITEQHVGDDEAEQRVAEELHHLVVGDAAADVLVRAGRVRHRVLEQPAIAEPVADRLLQRLELVAQPHDVAVPELRPVARDDALRVLRVAGVDPDAHLVETVDRQRKDRVRHVRREDRHDPVRFEQAADDLRFDVRMRPEDDDEVCHSA